MTSSYRKKFELPQGFYDVLESYCREVLRDQPQDILEFSFLYFKAMEEVSTLASLINLVKSAKLFWRNLFFF